MISTELDILNRIATGSQALIPYEGEVTREGLIRRGWGLGFLMGIIDVSTLKKQTSLKREEKKVVEVVSNIVFTGQGCNLHVFCGVEPVGEDPVARAYVRNELKVAGGGGLSIETGVESSPPGDGISRHWFWVGAAVVVGDTYKGLVQVDVTNDGRTIYSREDASCDVTKLSERSRLAVLESWGISGTFSQVLNLASNFRYIGAVMSAMAAHGLGNPYKEQREQQIWKTFLKVEYEKWKPRIA